MEAAPGLDVAPLWFPLCCARRKLRQVAMQGLSLSSSERTAGSATDVPGIKRAYSTWALAAVATITAARLIWLAVQPAGLYPDEAQYWFWAQHPAFGYYSKPPLVAWLIALTTAAFGDSEFAIRLAAPLLHAATAGIVYAIASRLYDRRTGFWAALAYVTLPGVSLSAFIISTDAVLLPCSAAAARRKRHRHTDLSAQSVVELEPRLRQLSACSRQCRAIDEALASDRLSRVPGVAVRRDRAAVFCR